MTHRRKVLATRSRGDRRWRSAVPCVAVLAWIAVGAAGRAMAGEAHAGFNVRVRVAGSGHAAAVSKSVASSRAAGAKAPADELRFSLTTGAGYFVRFEILDPAVERVEIRGLGRAITIASGARELF